MASRCRCRSSPSERPARQHAASGAGDPAVPATARPARRRAGPRTTRLAGAGDGHCLHDLSPSGAARKKRPPAAAGAALIVGSAIAFALDGPVAQAAYRRGLDPAAFGFWRALAGAVVLGARLDAGHSQAEISRATGLARPTVRRFARAGSAEELLGGTARGSRLDEFKPYLCRRWNEGARDGVALHAELQKKGWNGSARTVRRYLAQFREPGTAPSGPPAVPKARQITRLLLTRPDHLEPGEREQLAAIRAGCPHLDALAGHITAFAEMMDGLTGAAHLDPWLAAVEAADGQSELRSFATGIRIDKEAVLNGLTLPCSSGRVEGIVNKVKAVKRQMYGRASFTLLRKRIILHPA